MAENSLPRIPEQPLPVPETEPRLPEVVVETETPTPEMQVAVESALPAELPAMTVPVQSVTPAPVIPPLRQAVEKIMADGLDEYYARLDPPMQTTFKHVGEQTATQISVLLDESKVQVRKILDLLVSWLRLLPGVNSLFIEQEAKIKADELLAMRHPNSALDSKLPR